MRNVFDTPMGQSLLARIDAQQESERTARESAAARSHAARFSGIQQRQYSNARGSRLTSGWTPSSTSADGELADGLRNLRDRSRALIRDASYAKRARTVVVNNVIGQGIGLQAQVRTSRDAFNDRVNDDIEATWEAWCEADSCHTGGRLHFGDFERALMGEVFAAGDVFVRIHRRPFGRSAIPFALELVESERICDDSHLPSVPNGNQFRMGVEMDAYFRPVAYYIRQAHRNDTRWHAGSEKVERVSADDIIQLAVIDRWPQTRGEPWLHTALRRLNDMDGYSEAEITRARVQACNVGAIETSEDAASFGEEQTDGTVEMEVEPGIFKRLSPGEKLNALAPTAPNPAMDPFMRYMLREVAAGTSVSYESLSRDYSQSNYSSSRLALLDDRDLWRFYQTWFIRGFRVRVHREWLQAAVLSGAIKSVPVGAYAADPAKFEKTRFKPRGWSWIDPTKEVEAYKEAIKAGLTTATDVIAQTSGGRDIEDILNEREQELKMMEDRDLVFDVSPEAYEQPESAPPDKPTSIPDDESTDDPPKKRVVSFLRT